MASSHFIRGEMRGADVPDWKPLETILGSDELCAYFMWMFEVELADGTVLNAYKHRLTRCYLHLAADGRTYYYAGDHNYGTVDPAVAIAAVFRGRVRPSLTASERRALRSALRRASRPAT